MANKLSKTDKTLFIDDGHDRGPMTMFRVRFHPTQPKLLAQCVDRRVALWDLKAEPEEVDRKKEKYVVGALVCTHEIGWVRGIDIHPGGQWVATGSSDRSLRLWRWTDGQPSETPEKQTDGAHDGWIEALAYSPDGGQLATGGADRLVKIWNASDLQPIQTLSGHEAYVRDVAYSLDGKLLFSGAEDGLVIVRDAKSLEELRRIEFGSANDQFGQNPKHSGVHRLAISHDNRWLGVAGGEKLEIFDLGSGELMARADRVSMDVAFHAGEHVLAGGEDKVQVWQLETDKLTPPEKDKDGRPKKIPDVPGKELASVKRGSWSLGLQFSPDGNRLAMGKSDGTVELWELA